MNVRLGILVAVVVVTILALIGRIDVATARLIVVVHAVLAFSALVLNVTARRRLVRALAEIQTAAPVAATDPILVPPPDAAGIIAAVRDLGFELAGATDTTLLGRSIRAWIMTRPAGDIWAEVGVSSAPKAIFLSKGRGGRFVETAYPFGSAIDVPELLAGPVKSSPADALATQEQRLAAEGGPGRSVITLDDYLDAEQDQRASNSGLRIRQHLDRDIGPSIRDFALSLVVDTIALGALLVTAS